MKLHYALLALISFPVFAGPRYELRPLAVNEDTEGAASEQISEELQEKLTPIIEEWNAFADAETIVIEPILDDVRHVRAGLRILIGPLARSSYVVLRIKLTNSQGQVTEQSFRQDAGAWKGTFTLGVNDNRMLTAVTDDAVAYITEQHSHKVIPSEQ